MVRGTKFTVALLLVVVAVALVGYVEAKKRKDVTNAGELLRAMNFECYDQCQMLMKSEFVDCDSFCSFTTHVYDHHSAFARRFIKAGQPWDALEWAMRDVTRYKAEVKTEDQHALAIEFIRFYDQWTQYLKRRPHDEL